MSWPCVRAAVPLCFGSALIQRASGLCSTEELLYAVRPEELGLQLQKEASSAGQGAGARACDTPLSLSKTRASLVTGTPRGSTRSL